jgi:hypothetical protein
MASYEGILQSEPGKLVGREEEGQAEPAEGANGKDEEDGEARSEIRVENVDDVENGGKKCVRLSTSVSCSVFSDFFCQDPIDISIPRP